MIKTPNEERRRRNVIRRLVQSVARRAQYEADSAAWREAHKDDCECDLCQCFGQGACEGWDTLTDEEQEIASAAI